MDDPISEEMASRCQNENPSNIETLAVGVCRKEKRKAAKKVKRKQIRKEMALKELAEEEAWMNDKEEQFRIRIEEQEEKERLERERKEFEERERLWIEAAEIRKAEEEARRKIVEEFQRKQVEQEKELDEDVDWEYVDDGPAEIIWQGNEIIVKKKRVRVPKKNADQQPEDKDADRPTSNPLPPQSTAFAAYKNKSSVSAQQVFETVSQQIPNFGTEQDKAHCPFHIKTGACRFGSRCSRVHFHPDKSCTLLIKNMYNGPGLIWEQDEGLEYTDEEVEHSYEDFYEDVHTEFLKFGEIVNFKVCRNGSFHLRGNVYVHYRYLESAVLAYNSINGRYFAGKQITCEFVGVTRWKVAICGEYMKSRLKNCSHGTACNFIHCFRNPGGDYEWADWDNPPPKYWVKKMVVLFGPSDELAYNKHMESENREMGNSNRKKTVNGGRYRRRRSRSGEECRYSGSVGDYSDENRARSCTHSSRLQSNRRKATCSPDEHEQSNERYKTHDHDSRKHYYDESRVRRSSHSRAQSSVRKKEQEFPDEHNQSEEVCSPDDHPHVGKYKACDQDTGRCYGGNGNVSPSRAQLSSGRKEVGSPNKNENLQEKHNSNVCGGYLDKSRSCVHDSDGSYPDSNRIRRSSHLSGRARLSSQREHTDSHEHKKFDQNYDSEDHKLNDGKHRSCDDRSNIDYDENYRYNSRSRKRKTHNKLKVEMSYHDENDISKIKSDFDDHDRYDGRHGSLDCDSSGDYERNRTHSSNQSRREHASSWEKETDSPSPSKSRKCEENHKHRVRDRPHNLNQFKERNESRKLDSDDESFLSGKSFGGLDEESDSSWERVYDHSVHDATTRAHCRSTSEESGDLIENHNDAHHGRYRNRQSKRSSKHQRCKEKEYEMTVKAETGDLDAENLRSKKAYRKRSRSRSLIQCSEQVDKERKLQ